MSGSEERGGSVSPRGSIGLNRRGGPPACASQQQRSMRVVLYPQGHLLMQMPRHKVQEPAIRLRCKDTHQRRGSWPMERGCSSCGWHIAAHRVQPVNQFWS